MARPKKTEASVAIEKRLREMEKDNQKSTTSWTTASSGKKSRTGCTQCATCGGVRENIAWTTPIFNGKRVELRSKLARRSFQRKKPKRVLYIPIPTSRLMAKRAYEEF